MNRPSATAVDESADYGSWELPDSPIQVRISAEAIERIRAETMRGMGLLPRRGVEVGGVLLGTVANDDGAASVTIDDVLPAPIEYAAGPTYNLSEKDKTNLRDVIRAWDRSFGRPIYIVGFYRTQTREGLSLAPEDLELFAGCFPDPSSVALLIRPRAEGACEAGLFFRDGEGVTAEPQCLEFPPARDRTPDEPAVEPPVVPPPSFLSAAAPAFPRRQPLWVSWWIQVPILAALLLVDGYMGYIAAGQFRPEPVKARAVPQNPYALSLMVVQYGDNLHLTWDHDAPALASAERGMLSIRDGGQSRSLELSMDQLRNGSVIYRRLSSHVTLRLELFLDDKRSVSESWNLNETPPL